MTDDNVIRVPRVTRTGPFSALSIWPPDETGIVTATFHSLVRPIRPRPGALMNIDAINKEISQVPG
jgi:hypothetical protein